VGIPELRRTTRDEPDYDRLMRFRLDLLRRRGLTLPDIQRVIADMEPLEGAGEFLAALRERAQFLILSDTFEEFARPLLAKLGFPTLFCNTLETSPEGIITNYVQRQRDGKRRVVAALRSLNMEVFAAGDSFNDLGMIEEAGAGCLFRAPGRIRAAYPDIPGVETYDAFLERIDLFLDHGQHDQHGRRGRGEDAA